ncbi:TonB-dependent siderophore receptor [Gilvimarinus sp. SDUM040013]|uniref:TonB-dependent siderophore receptor n=1 Tax=Gilvimarinus gilvus TaxID=3058038 RepID=A0ABU4S464_9GAMM|nr:TonB-dependent siderophore receptor [Gilvimarinus sp. SDUM040013]MDO3384892.1 TonB-dependent siderophore receptor [Gilvimarinus sp. SDUM040013]MDX6850683.1 TonB-dependent siderophore receptor [Gilvimarinus sp. SDUM040013]
MTPPKRMTLALAVTIALPHATLADSKADTKADQRVETMLVTGRAQSLYRVDETSVSTRINADLTRIPASVQIINADLIEDQGARDARDLYRAISGVSVFSYSGVTFRGFRQDEVLYDGLRGDPYAGFTVPRLFGVDQVEVLKGPSGALYGAGAPGGLINYATSQATLENYGRAQLVAGNFDLTGVNVAATGQIGDSDFGYRVAMLKETEQPFREHSSNDNDQGDLGFIWLPSDKTSIKVKYSFVDQTLGANRLRGVPADEDGNFLVAPSWNHNEPTDFLTLRANSVYSRIEHSFSDGIRLDVAMRYYDNQEKQNYHEPRGLYDSNGDGVDDMMARQFRDQIRNSEGTSAYANLVFEFATGSIEHQLLTGLEYYNEDSDFKAKRGSPIESGGVVPPLSLYDPLYGQTSRAQYGLDLRGWESDTTSSLTQSGLYIQDLVRVSERFDILASLRFNDFESDSNGVTDSDSATTYRLGGVYHITENLNTYLSYSEGFEPQSAANQDTDKGGPFAPEESENMELGAKLNLWDGRARLNLAIYETEKRNVLQGNPEGDVDGDGVDDLVAIGKVRSRGFEFDLSADLQPLWTMTLNYGYNRTRVLEATTGITNATGDKFANTPEHQIGLWTRYDFPSISSAIAFGADYKSDQISIQGDYVKPYTTFDASWQSEWDLWKLQLNVSNLFNKEYAESGFIHRTGHFPGEPRRVVATLSRTF